MFTQPARTAVANREKRTEIVKARITPTMREQLELDLRQRSNVLSISDYLFELVEDRLTAIKIEEQKIGRRFGQQ